MNLHLFSFLFHRNPALFAYRFSMHDFWPASQGPRNDKFYLGDNPQYSLELDYGAGVGATSGQVVSIWILLSRHLSDSTVKKFKRIETEEGLSGDEDDDFLACHVISDTSGERVHASTRRHVSGLYTNDPHNLICFDVDPKDLQKESGTVAFTLVLSQISKSRDISYTLSVLCTRPVILSRAPPLPNYRIPFNSAWTKDVSSGGSTSHEYFNINPMYRLVVGRTPARVHLQMFYPESVQASISVVPCEDLVSTDDHLCIVLSHYP